MLRDTKNLSTPRVWRAGKWLSLATLVALALLVAGVRGPNGVAVNLAQAAGLDAHHGVDTGIEGGRAAVRFHGDHVFLHSI